MKYCPYCGTALVDGAVSFCMECGKKLPAKEVQAGSSQTDQKEKVHQKTPESGMARKKKAVGKRREKPPQKQNDIIVKEPVVERKQKSPEHSEQIVESTREPQQIWDTNPEDDYDGYYEDILPADTGRFREGMDKNLIKKVIVIIAAVLLIVALCVGMMYVF